MASVKNVPAVLQVGAGRWGTNHLRVLLRLRDEGLLRLVGVQESDPARRKALESEFGVKTFADDSGLKEADAVDIVVPTYSHYEHAKKALLADKHVMVEKPLAETSAQGLELAALAKKSGKTALVGHIFRHNPAADLARKMIADREIGRVRFMRGRFMGFRYQEHDAGILITTAIHFLYLSDFFHGRPTQAVRARTFHTLGTPLDDVCAVHLEYGDAFTFVESDYFTPGKWRTFDIIGTQGALFVDLLKQTVSVHRKYHVRGQDRFEAYDGGVIENPLKFQEPLELELRHFLACVRGEAKPLTNFEDGVTVLKTIEAAYQSAKTDRTVPVV